MVLLAFMAGRGEEHPELFFFLRDGAPIVLPSSFRGDPALSLAAADLSDYLSSRYQAPFPVVADDDLVQLPRFAFLVVDGRRGWKEEWGVPSSALLPLSEEGYLVQRVGWGAQGAVVVAGRGALGMAYGLFGLQEQIKLNPGALSHPFGYQKEPAFTFRLVSGPMGPGGLAPQDAIRWGYDAVAIEPWTSLVLYDGFDPAIMSPSRYPEARAWVEENRRRARLQIQEAKALHLKVVSIGDVFSFPRQVLSLYPQEVSRDGRPNFCLSQPKVRALLEYSLDEVLREFPEIDAIVVRTGENYPLGPLVGNTPQDALCNPEPQGLPKAIGATLGLIRAKVVDQYHKTYIHRAWDLGNEGFHSEPQVVDAVLSETANTNGIVLSFKHTETDFWRYNALNRNLVTAGFDSVVASPLGLGGRMVEFQAAREYEGKGAFPNFLGEVFAQGGQEILPKGGLTQTHGRGVRALWVWASGGGWGGPRPASSLWINANIYALSRLAWDPAADPGALAQDWARLRFGKEAAPYIARLLIKSSEASLKAFYVACYAQKNGPWAPNALWVRDDIIGGGQKMLELYRACREEPAFSQALAEKAQAVRLVDEMASDLQKAMPFIKDPALREEAKSSLLYQRSLFETVYHYYEGVFHYFRWEEGGSRWDKEAAKAHFSAWKKSWQHYTKDIPLLPRVATLYNDWGMVGTVEAAQAKLGH